MLNLRGCFQKIPIIKKCAIWLVWKSWGQRCKKFFESTKVKICSEIRLSACSTKKNFQLYDKGFYAKKWPTIKTLHLKQKMNEVISNVDTSTLKPKVGKKNTLCTNQEGLSLNCQMSCSWHSFTVTKFHWFANFLSKVKFPCK